MTTQNIYMKTEKTLRGVPAFDNIEENRRESDAIDTTPILFVMIAGVIAGDVQMLDNIISYLVYKFYLSESKV